MRKWPKLEAKYKEEEDNSKRTGKANGQTWKFHELIKTITKFSNVIASKQPNLRINWTVFMLVINLEPRSHSVLHCFTLVVGDLGSRLACNWTIRVILRVLLRCTL